MNCDIPSLLSSHLGCSHAESQRLKAQFESELRTGPYVYDKSHDVRAIDRLDRAIAELVASLEKANFSNFGWIEAQANIQQGNFYETGDIKKTNEYIESMGLPLTRALNTIHSNERVLRRSLRNARRIVSESANSKRTLSNVNTQAIAIAGFAAKTWRQQKRIEPPSEARIERPFGRFIQDLMDATETDGDARSAYRAYRENQSAILRGK